MTKKKQHNSMHVVVAPHLKDLLVPFSKNRGQSMTATIQYALEKLFEEEETDPVKAGEIALRAAILRRFTIPRGYKLRSFWITLHTLASRYPKASSRKYWGEMIFLSPADKTHKEIVDEITEELRKTR
jgi:hypothetical protein